MTPKQRKNRLQRSASSFGGGSQTTIALSSDDIGSPYNQTDMTEMLSFKDMFQTQDLDDNIVVPDAADYHAPFGETTSERSEGMFLSDIHTELGQYPHERRQELQEQQEDGFVEPQEQQKDGVVELQESLRSSLRRRSAVGAEGRDKIGTAGGPE